MEGDRNLCQIKWLINKTQNRCGHRKTRAENAATEILRQRKHHRAMK